MNKRYTIGVDIGATKMAAGLISGNEVLKREVRIYDESDKLNKKNLLKTIKEGIESVWNEKVSGIGLGLAGATNPEKGIFLEGVNFPASFRNVNLNKELKNFGCSIHIDNDVRVFALGEALYGAGKKYESVFGLTLGTGVGGALIAGQKIWPGRNNGAGEIGHTIIQMVNGKTCSDGHSGHLEAYVSGKAIQKMINERLGDHLEPKNLDELIKEGNLEAKKIIDLAGRALAVGLTNVIQTINPDVIVVGGSLVRIQSLWRAARSTSEELITYHGPRSTPIVKSRLGHDTAILGAASLLLPPKLTQRKDL